jgi:hypothetical protein
VGISIAAALLSAALFALTNNLQRAAASAVPEESGGVAGLMRRLLADPRWLLGGLIGAAALGLHTLALATGSVLVVQSVMAVGLVLALTLEAVRDRRPLLPRELGGAVLVVAGVAAVVAVGRPSAGADVAGRLGVVTACAAVVLAALGLVVRARHTVRGEGGARLLAAAGGVCFAVDAVFLQQAAVVFGSPAAGRLGSALGLGAGTGPVTAAGAATGAGPDTPGLAEVLVGLAPGLVGGVGFVLASVVGTLAVQRAYQAAPLRCVQPAVAATEPVTAFLVGVTLLHEGVRGGLPGFVLLLAGVAAIVAGIITGVRPSGPAVPTDTLPTDTVPAGTVPVPGRSGGQPHASRRDGRADPELVGTVNPAA